MLSICSRRRLGVVDEDGPFTVEEDKKWWRLPPEAKRVVGGLGMLQRLSSHSVPLHSGHLVSRRCRLVDAVGEGQIFRGLSMRVTVQNQLPRRLDIISESRLVLKLSKSREPC